MPENNYTVQPNLFTLLDLLNDYLEQEERQAEKQLLDMSISEIDLSNPHILFHVENTRDQLSFVTERRLEVALLLLKLNQEDVSKRKDDERDSKQIIAVTQDIKGKLLS